MYVWNASRVDKDGQEETIVQQQEKETLTQVKIIFNQGAISD